MNWKAFLQGLISAAAGGAATAVTAAFTDPQHTDLHHLGPIAGVGALIGVAALFRPSPVQSPVNPPTQPPSNFPQTK